jgi:hypothetical protein
MIRIELHDPSTRQIIPHLVKHVLAALLIPEQRLRARQDHAHQARPRDFDGRGLSRRRRRDRRLVRTCRYNRQGKSNKRSQ